VALIFFLHWNIAHYDIKFSKPKVASFSAIGNVQTPFFVKLYSTFGGISGKDFLMTRLFFMSEFNSCIKTFSLMPGLPPGQFLS
jgi:hypothetical protein